MRFDALARNLESFDAASPVVAMLRTAADDERRHVELCRSLASSPLDAPTRVKEIAPIGATVRDIVLYEIIAAACIAETESVATLTALLKQPMRRDIDRTVREIAADEVGHAKLGWAHLARESASRSVAYAGAWLPAMLDGTVDSEGFVDGADGGAPPDDLRALGVLPLQQKRDVFIAVLEDAVFPGLARFGLELGPAQAWLQAFRARGATPGSAAS